jgi:hypothetical protein
MEVAPMLAMRALSPFAVILALTAVAGAEEERYQLERTDNGYVRLNTATGEMSICEERSGQLVCKAAAEERAAFQDEIDRLQGKLDAVEARVAKLEGRAIPEALLPSDEEVDKSLDIMEKFFRRFMGVVQEFDKDKDGPQAQPQKT